MKAYRMSKDCNDETIEQKIEKIKEYSVSDLLYLLREIENHPKQYDEEIIKACVGRLNDKNIICM